MKFNIHAVLANGSTVFTATLNYLPRLNEEIEVNGRDFVIKRIRHLIREGSYYGSNIQIVLEHK